MFVSYRRGTVVDGSLDATFRDEDRVVREPDNAAFAQRPGHWTLGRLAALLVDDPEHRVERLLERFLVRPAGQALGDGIEVGDAPFDIGGDNGIPDAAQRDAHQLAVFARPHLREAHRLADSDD